ncbi:hypothetical protein FHW58_001157 [Duganella sp. 1224]|uniref:hypothetical protein n=1 Tax=Duganella sp. 1224 TaxID=2587052 RepID=UPI0015CE7EE0|nr:hypothetical protein [Duganella sp. 1224]NYE60005.1 hypothetical protein [Duganella sp. 1224]
MRLLIFIAAALLSSQALAGTNCRPLSQAPATIALTAQHGVTTMRSTDKFVATSEPQPFSSPNFSFSIVAVSSCNEGLEIKLLQTSGDSQHFLQWNQSVVVNGKAGTDHHITVTAKRARQ